MTALLEFRQKLCESYGKYEIYVRSCVKFILAFCVFYIINWQIGSISYLKTPAAAFSLAFICTLLPVSALSLLMCFFIAAHMCFISLEAGVVAACVFLIMLLIYFIYKPRYGALMAVSLLAGMMNISGILAIPVGLLCGPSALIPVAFGLMSYGMVIVLRQNYTVLESAAVRLTSMEKVTYFINECLTNERFLLLISGVLLTILVVYAIRRLPYSYAWAVAIASGAACYVLIIMIGNVGFGVSVSILYLSIAVAAGVVLSWILHFFHFLLDGAHAEYLQYEDEEYVYYVKAIPKYSVTRSDKKITKITEPGEQSAQDETDFQDEGMTPEDYFQE